MERAERGGVDRTSFPPEFIARMERLLGREEAEEFLAAAATPAIGLRVNTLRVSPERFEAISPFALTPLPFPPAGYAVADQSRPGKHPYHAAGLYYLQDPGAMVVGALAAPRPGDRVLDLAAAPGGKATHLAALTADDGVLVANDVHPVRARELAGNLERVGARHAIVTCESPERLARHFGAYFDRVLLDAPCSGESMFHKSQAARDGWGPAAVVGCARRQTDLIATAAELVRPGGLLVYSTCTFAPEENEGVAAAFLATQPDFEIAALDAPSGASPGRPDWLPPGVADAAVGRTLRLWPHLLPGAGHFVAAFRRLRGEEGGVEAASAGRLPASALDLLTRFQKETLRRPVLDPARVVAIGSELFERTGGAPDTGSLRVIRPGWWLGTVVKDRFEPAHTFAMGLAADAAIEPVVLSSTERSTAAYLRGETLELPGRAGWVLVTVDGHPLGWGKRVGRTVKNHYPKGLRTR